MIWASLDHPTLADIQALCLLVIHEWGTRNAVRAYVYLGQAARMAQMFRVVHANHQQSEPDRFLQEESFRRTLWLIYILDCFLTSSPGRYPALSKLDIKDVALPCGDMNYNFGSPVYVRTLEGNVPPNCPTDHTGLSEVGEFGHIVLATEAWRHAVEMMTTTTLDTFDEERCQVLEAKVDQVRQSLPHHFADKPGQIQLHITMGSGYTYAMIHCLLHCASIFINRRRILQLVTAETFTMDDWRMSPAQNLVESIFTASHSIIAMLTLLEAGNDKDSILCFPIFMLFAGFTAGSTVAYLRLKGLSPLNANETAYNLVNDSLRLMKDGAESWHLVIPWHRHLNVMSRVLHDANAREDRALSREDSRAPIQRRSPSIKDDVVSQPDINNDVMDYEQMPRQGTPQGVQSMPIIQNVQGVHGVGPQGVPGVPQAPMESRGSEPPVARRPGITTINGTSADASTPATGTPPPGAQDVKNDSPAPASNSSNGGGPGPGPALPKEAGAGVDMTASELCAAFERQLLELDDLAAFMGGGV